jgi:hypothetical protein
MVGSGTLLCSTYDFYLISANMAKAAPIASVLRRPVYPVFHTPHVRRSRAPLGFKLSHPQQT